MTKTQIKKILNGSKKFYFVDTYNKYGEPEGEALAIENLNTPNQIIKINLLKLVDSISDENIQNFIETETEAEEE